MLLNTDHKINLLQKTNKIDVDPPPKITSKADTKATAHYFTQVDAYALLYDS